MQNICLRMLLNFYFILMLYLFLFLPAIVDFKLMVLNLGSSKGLQKYEAIAYSKIIHRDTILDVVALVDVISMVYMSNFSINLINSQ
jgi:hypothetical protein